MRASQLDIAVSRSNLGAIRLHIEYLPLAAVTPAARMLRKHGKAQIKELAAGIERYGFNVPLLIDETGKVVAGHARLAAAELLRLAEVPVIRIAHLTDVQLRVFRIFENRIAEKAEWDEAELNLEFEELRFDNPTLELSDSGFAIGEIDMMQGRARTASLDDLNDVREPGQDPPVTKLGDVWICGRHRVICGDSTDPAVIAELVGDQRVRQVVGDLPYNLPTRSFSSSGRHEDFVQGAGEMSSEEFTSFIAQATEAAKPVLKEGALLYYFMDYKHIVELIAGGARAGLDYRQLLVWVKSTVGMGSHYRSGHELIGVFRYGDAPHRNNIELGQYGRNRSNVLSYPGVMGTSSGKRALKLHPTVKNVALIADLLLDASAPGEVVLDNFGGSGTTLVAAERVGRTARLSELHPGYVDIAVMRFNMLGTEQAQLEATGGSFEEVRAERFAVGSPTDADQPDTLLTGNMGEKTNG
jgi:DNA modification methylase